MARGRIAVPPELRVSQPGELPGVAAALIAGEITDAVQRRGRARVALAGGSTPRPVYRELASEPHRSQVPWRSVHVYFGDERCVAADDVSSNYRMATDSFLSRVAIPASSVYRVPVELGAAASARAYAEVLGEDALDIVLLGMGGDGHTASLFPLTPFTGGDRVLATTSPTPPIHRVSLGLGPINAAQIVIFLIAGADKAARAAEIHAQIVGGNPVLPAAYVQPESARLIWCLDTGAARLLADSAH